MSSIEEKTTPKRPLGISLLFLGSLILFAVSILRFQQALSQWNNLQDMLTIPMLYFAMTGLVFALAWLMVAWILWHPYSWSPLAVRFVMIAYVIFYWLDRLLLVDPGSQVSNEWFAAVATLVLMIWIFWLFSISKVRKYFGDYDES